MKEEKRFSLEREMKNARSQIKTLQKELSAITQKLDKQSELIDSLVRSLELIGMKSNVFQAVSEVMGLSLELDEILELLMDSAIKLTRTEAGSLLLIDEQKKQLVFKVAKGEKAAEVRRYKLNIGDGIAGWVAKSGVALIVPSPEKDKRFKREITEEINYQIHNILCVPLKVKGKVIGVIEVMNKFDKAPFDEEDLAALSSLANQVAVVIENTRLFRASERKIYELTTLMEVSKAVSSTLELSDLLKIIMELSKDVMQAEASSLMLIDEERGDLTFEVALGEKGEEVKRIRLPIGKGIAGWVAREGKPLLVPDVQKDARFFREVDEKTHFKTRSILCVPLKVKEKIIGALEVINPITRESFEEGDIGLFEAIAREAAVAIENARLFEGLQELFLDTIKSLAAAIDAKDPYTHGHSERVTRFSLAIAKEMNLSAEKLKKVQQASLLHDIGKIGIRDNVLQKPERLSRVEFDEIKKHPIIGANIVGSVRRLRDVVPGIRSHHERFGGGGYPDGCRGEEIDLIGRIISVADAFDAMTSDRPYRRRLTDAEALERIKDGKDTQFDSQVVGAFLSAYKKGLITR